MRSLFSEMIFEIGSVPDLDIKIEIKILKILKPSSSMIQAYFYSSLSFFITWVLCKIHNIDHMHG